MKRLSFTLIKCTTNTPLHSLCSLLLWWRIFILEDESEEGIDTMQLLSSLLKDQHNPKSACAFQLLYKQN